MWKVGRDKNMEWEQIYAKKAQIITLLENAHGYAAIRGVMKQCHMLLREIAQLMEDDEMQHASNGRVHSVSELMPCLLCNDHYPIASELSKGIRYEPIPGKGYVFLCWECCHGLKKSLDRQFNGMAYSFLFSLGKDVQELREAVLKTPQKESPLMSEAAALVTVRSIIDILEKFKEQAVHMSINR
jgi:hypothetical protein